MINANLLNEYGITDSNFVLTNLVKIGDAAPDEIAIFIGSLSTTDGIKVLPKLEFSAILIKICFIFC